MHHVALDFPHSFTEVWSSLVPKLDLVVTFETITCVAQDMEPGFLVVICGGEKSVEDENLLSLELVYCFATDSRSAHDDN